MQTYGDELTAYHRHMISFVVFFYPNKLKSMLVDNAVTDMGFFDDYSDVDPRARTMRGNCIITFLLYVAQCITFHKKNVTETLISEEFLKSFYSRLLNILQHLLISKRLASDFILRQENQEH